MAFFRIAPFLSVETAEFEVPKSMHSVFLDDGGLSLSRTGQDCQQALVLQIIPKGPVGTIEYQDWFVPAGKVSAQLQDAITCQKDVLQPEDTGLCESVQKGLRSKGYNQGRFVIDPSLSELSGHGVHHFQSLVMAALWAKIS